MCVQLTPLFMFNETHHGYAPAYALLATGHLHVNVCAPTGQKNALFSTFAMFVCSPISSGVGRKRQSCTKGERHSVVLLFQLPFSTDKDAADISGTLKGARNCGASRSRGSLIKLKPWRSTNKDQELFPCTIQYRPKVQVIR
jgi:hypothetical protein